MTDEASYHIQMPFSHHFARVAVSDITRVLGLYAVLVFFEFSYSHMLEHFFSETYSYFYMTYEKSQSETYFWICILTPLSVLPAGTRMATAAQVIVPIFMTFAGLAAPLFFVRFVTPDVFPYVYACFFLCYFLIAISARTRFASLKSPIDERGYKRLLWLTVCAVVITLGYGMTQDFHLVGFAQLYENRYSDDVNGVFVQRIAVLYVFCFGGLFVALSLMFRKKWCLALAFVSYVVCYGLLYEKTALLAPAWFIYIYLTIKYFSRDSTAKFYIALAAPFYVGVILFMTSTPSTENIWMALYMGLVMLREYAVPANAPGLYHLFFQTHPHTYWAHITGFNYFLHYPYGNHTVAIEMQRRYNLGNYNASFLASDAIQAYGYQALPAVGAVVGAALIALNTASRGFGLPVLSMLMIMPAIAITNIPFATAMLTSGILFLMLYMAWMPRGWLDYSHHI